MQQLTLDYAGPVAATRGLWPGICTFDNLLRAYRKARRGKRGRDAVARFELEAHLLELQRQLGQRTWRPGPYRQFTIRDKKPRLISAAPFPDRVVHHAIMNQLEPALDARLYDHCYACRKGRGVHAAVDRYQRWARRYPYVLKLDIQRYFPSIDHGVVRRQLAAAIADDAVREALGRIVANGPGPEPGKGLAIGNLTSQFLANWYLNDLDHRVAAMAGVGVYLRYVDDLFLLGDSKPALWRARAAIAAQLSELGLQLHTHKSALCRTHEKVPVLGYQISRERRWLASANGRAATRRIRGLARACREGRISLAEVRPAVHAWIGHAQHGETAGLRRALFQSCRFRGTTDAAEIDLRHA